MTELNMLFGDVDGLPVGIWPFDGEGNSLASDGVRVYSSTQASERFGLSDEALRAIWRATWGGVAYMSESPAIALAQEPIESDKAAAVETPTRSAKQTAPAGTKRGWSLQLELLRQMRYRWMSPAQFEFFTMMCDMRRLNAWSNQIYAELRPEDQAAENPGDAMPVILIGIDGLRAIAHRTGVYAGCDETIFTYGNPGDRIPIEAKITVYKLVGNQRMPFPAEAKWSEYYEGAPPNPVRDQYPSLCLGKCAEALALRKAFPDEMGGIYEREEWRRLAKPATAAPLASTKENAERTWLDPDDGHVTYDDETAIERPRTQAEFERALSALGYRTADARQQVANDYQRRFPELYSSSRQRFWAAVVEQVRARRSETAIV